MLEASMRPPDSRLITCERCGAQVEICRDCDQGNIYCGRACAREARLEWQREICTQSDRPLRLQTRATGRRTAPRRRCASMRRHTRLDTRTGHSDCPPLPKASKVWTTSGAPAKASRCRVIAPRRG
jgi:hypothetical protein